MVAIGEYKFVYFWIVVGHLTYFWSFDSVSWSNEEKPIDQPTDRLGGRRHVLSKITNILSGLRLPEVIHWNCHNFTSDKNSIERPNQKASAELTQSANCDKLTNQCRTRVGSLPNRGMQKLVPIWSAHGKPGLAEIGKLNLYCRNAYQCYATRIRVELQQWTTN